MKKLSVIALLILISEFTFAQLKISGEIRPRIEFRHGYKSPADSAAIMNGATTQRTRINFDYQADKVKFFVSLQDVRTWGGQKQLVGNESSSVSIHEAWGEAGFSKTLSLKAGRQEIVLDDQRMFGNVGWTQQARSHDAAIIKYTGAINAQLGFAFNRDEAFAGNYYSIPNIKTDYKDLAYLWLNKKNDNLGISFLALANGKPYDRLDTAGVILEQIMKYTGTFGPSITYKKEALSIAFNAYYQMGTTNAPTNTVSAYDIGLDVGYKLTDNINVNVGYERLSGHNQTDTTEAYNDVIHSFNPLYGTNHKFNGFMDYFYVGNWIGSVGLQDIYLKAGYKKDKISADLHYHLFMSAAEILDDDKMAAEILAGTSPSYSAASSMLGSEIDLVLGYTVTKGVALKAGFSTFLASDGYTYVTKNLNVADANLSASYWGWIMLVVNPTFLDTTPPKPE